MLHLRPLLRSPVGTRDSISITFKGLGTYDYPSAFTWPPLKDEDATNMNTKSNSRGPHPASTSPSSSPHDDYVTRHRSPFSVLRSRQSRVNRCGAGMLGLSFDTSAHYSLSKQGEVPCSKLYCCCSALMYPTTSETHTELMERVRDDFLWSLKLGGVEDLLRTALGENLHARLMRHLRVSPMTAAVLACSDPIKMAQLMSGEALPAVDTARQKEKSTSAMPDEDPANGTFTARLLLSADEENRIRWLQEEAPSIEPTDYYSRAPSLRALFIMWSVLQLQQRERHIPLSGSSVGGSDGSSGRGGGDRWGQVSARCDSDSGPRARSLATSFVPRPTMNEVRHVLLRMTERRMEVTMSDIAVLAAIGAGGNSTTTDSTAIPDSEFWDRLVKLLKPKEVAAALCPSSSSSSGISTSTSVTEETLGLQHVLLLCLLLRYVLLVRVEVAAQKDTTSSQLLSRNKMLLPITAFEAASDVMQLRKSLTEDPAEGRSAAPAAETADAEQRISSVIQEAIVALSDVVLKHAYDMAEASHLPSSSPHLPELTTWLLREMVSSPVCEFHLKRLVDRSITEALVALEKSGLLNRSTIDLKVVVRRLLPLLESCGSEDLYTSVLRDVLSALEEKARRDGYAFSAEDLKYLAELGTKLFSNNPSDSAAGGYGLFDEFARGQMEQLHVMDGSPWALCVSSYRSLREMLQGIVRDQRRLKEQVQDQLRQLSNASSLSAVMTGSDGEAEAEENAKDTTGAARSSNTSPSLNAEGGASDSSTSSTTANAAVASSSAGQANIEQSNTGASATQAASSKPAAPPRIPVPPMLRQRFLVLIEELVKSQVNESSAHSEKPIVVSSELFSFVTQHVPVPNIQDEYRRKIFLLVNVAEDPETTRQRVAQRKSERKRRLQAEATTKSEKVEKLHRRVRRKAHIKGDAASAEGHVRDNIASADTEEGEEKEVGSDPHGGANDIPAELRFLVSSLPLTLSPWASVMILREVLAESAGRNPRYTYVLNAAIDLQLPISTTRSRIATTLNMWRFLTTQSHKLSLKESLMMKQRCAWNLPLSYILSSYWSLLTWLMLASIIILNVVGVDWESQIVANSLFRMFAPWEEICATPSDADGAEETWTTQATADLAADYFEQAEIADRRREEHRRSRTNVFLSSASYLILGHDDQRRPMTVIPIGSNRAAPAEERAAEEYAAATAVLRELSLHAPFPFFVDFERALPIELMEARIAERIRRVSFNNTWFLPRMVISTFPLGRQYTEHKLILHTCTQANRTRRRVTFLLYIHDGVAVTPQFIRELNESYLSKHANLVLVVHESGLLKGGTTPASLAKISDVGAANQGAGIGLESLESLANAAADMIGSVLPDEVKEATTAAGAAPARQVRVLPFCRQYYAMDGTVVADAVYGNAKSAAKRENTASVAEHIRAWWRCVTSYVAESAHASSRSTAEAAASLPVFASAFSAQRTFLHRSHQEHQQQQQQRSNRDSSNSVSFVERWARWGERTLSGVAIMAESMVPVTGDGKRKKRKEEKEEAERVYRKDEPAGGEEHTPAQENGDAPTASHADYAVNFSEDAKEERIGKDVVSVPFTALRRLMSEVSAPVPMPRKKHSTTSGGNTSTPAAGISSSTPAEANVSGKKEYDETSPPHNKQVLSPSAVSSSSEGWRSRFWPLFRSSTTAAQSSSKENEEGPAAPLSVRQAALQAPYGFQYNNGSSDNNSSVFVSVERKSPVLPTPRAAQGSSSSSASAGIPTADAFPRTPFKWESEWQKTERMLAQLRHPTRAEA